MCALQLARQEVKTKCETMDMQTYNPIFDHKKVMLLKEKVIFYI